MVNEVIETDSRNSMIKISKFKALTRFGPSESSVAQVNLIKDADAERDRKNWAAAAALYRQVLVINPLRHDITVQLGHMLKEMGDFDAADQAYRAVLAITPDDADLHLQVGHLRKLQRNFAEARDHYGKALRIAPDNENARLEYDGLSAVLAGNNEVSTVPPMNSPPQEAPVNIFPNELERIADAAVSRLSVLELRAAGDQARDMRAWANAGRFYRDYLDHVPSDTAIWIQLGHSLKEAGDLAGGETAYRVALKQAPQDADLYLQLGHVLKLQGERAAALQAYQKSFSLEPLRATIRELQSLDPLFNLSSAVPKASQATNTIFIEITDLLDVLSRSAIVSGIQRVQLGLLSHLLTTQQGRVAGTRVVVWQAGVLWELPSQTLRRLIDTLGRSSVEGMAERSDLLSVLDANSRLVAARAGDSLIESGAIWLQGDLTASHDRLKNAGVRMGACIYDFIPLTNPEYTHTYLTERFSNAVSAALLHLDFVLTISDYTRNELERLLTKGGYPAIPSRTVRLAQESLTDAASGWTPSIVDLQHGEYVLCVGTLHAHKNHAALLHAWRLLLQRGIELPSLVFAGKRGYGVDDLFGQLEATNYLDGRVKVLDDLADGELAMLYQNCLFTVFPSIVEGWGLPVGESLAYGKVCIASNTSSVPEVGGDFALYVDPFNIRSIADAIAGLVLDRRELARREASIERDFIPRSWEEYGQDFLRAAADLSTRERLPAVTLSPGQVVRPRQGASPRRYGTGLPPRSILVGQALRRILLIDGWHPPESWGSWMDSKMSRLGCTTTLAQGTAVRVLLQFRTLPWPRRNRITVRAGCGATRSMSLLFGTRNDFLFTIDCTTIEEGRIDLTLVLEGSMATEHDPRALGIGLVRFLYLERDVASDTLPTAVLVRPSAATDSAGNLVVPRDLAALKAFVHQSFIFGDGWSPLEDWGAWMGAREANIGFNTDVAPGSLIRVAIRLRIARNKKSVHLIVRSSCGASATLRVSSAESTGQLLWLDCRVGLNRRVSLTLLAGTPGGQDCAGRIGLTDLIYGLQDSVADRLSLTEALLFPRAEQLGDAAPLGIMNFTVTGHVKGSYSLAVVNRRLALSLEALLPGKVRVEQVEGQPVRDMSHLPREERAGIGALTERQEHEDGSEVVISQHWPVWVPPRPGDLTLAYVFWEESLIPNEMVETLNHGFKGVLASSKSVAKTLIDSGVFIPVRVAGFAPNLSSFKALAEQRSATRNAITPSDRFTFLHISSCFPRKGVDVLLAAFAKAFRRDDPVRLVIKGFPNPHNTVGIQLRDMILGDPQAPLVELIDKDLLPGDILKLYESADAIVLPTRGEGYNIPAAEALAAGVPLIVTGFGAQTDFATTETAQLIDYRFAASESHLASQGSIWVEPDIDALSNILRTSFNRALSIEGGDQPAGAALAAQVAKGRACAEQLGDGDAWARRIVDIASELMSMPPPTAADVVWVSTWKVRCGIAEYSRMLLNRFGDASQKLTVLCDERTDDRDLSALHGWSVAPAWRVLDPRRVEGLAQAIDDTGAALVIIQHHPGLINWPELTILLNDVRLSSRTTIVTLHNVRDLTATEPAKIPHIVAALRTVSRVLVHTIRDLNLLKGHGLIDNVTLFPHGAERHEIAPRVATPLDLTSAPLIGSYGFFLPHKGFEALIRAFSKLRTQWRNARLRLVTSEYPIWTSGEELARCRGIASALGLDEAIEWHTTYLENAQSLALLNECDLVVLPYQETAESSSAAVRTAISSRAPVMVTPIAIFDDVGDAVLRLSGTSPDAIADGLATAIHDASARTAVQDRAARWLKANDWVMLGERLNRMGRSLTLSSHRDRAVSPTA
jgi:glycosyltransferase involved in cell wall biosynthesis/tetratricopeptide (TPR) repeat protein